MKTKLKTLLLVLLATSSLSAQELKPLSLFAGRLTLDIPVDFKPMDDGTLRLKYPSERRPTLVYTNKRANTNVALNWLAQNASQDGLSSFYNDFVAYFEKAFPQAKWKSKGMTEINGRKVGYLELVTPGLDTDIYNLMFFTDLDGRLLLCSFNCVIRDLEQWQDKAKEIMYSLRVEQ